MVQLARSLHAPAYLSPAADDSFHLELLAGPIEHLRPNLNDLSQSLTYGGYQHFCPASDQRRQGQPDRCRDPTTG